MEIDILNFSSYRLMFGDLSNISTLIGTQTIYSNAIQNVLIKSFLDTEDQNQLFTPSSIEQDMRKYCFNFEVEEKSIILHPTQTCGLCAQNFIFVSDEIYDQYFKNNNSGLRLHFYYDLSKIKDLKLKRIEGNFPRDDSLEILLTQYFESCMVVNHGQQFTIQYGFDMIDFIKFEIVTITYVDTPIRDIKDRFDEINITVKLNQLATNDDTVKLGLKDCKSIVSNFKWFYNTIGKEKPCFGDVSFTNVNIDFEINEQEKVTPLPFSSKKKEEKEPEKQEISLPQPTPEELRQKRLAFFNKQN